MALSNSTLFSASRDGCIKKWNLNKLNLTRTINLAHKDSIQALSLIKNVNEFNNDHLISGCKGGILKVWDADNCKMISEIKAHSAAINSIDNNRRILFTGSADNSISFWIPRSSFDPSPDFSDQIF